MARSFAPAGDNIRGLGADGRATFFHKLSNRWYILNRRDGAVYLRRHQTGFGGKETNVVEARVDYVLGSGNHAQGLIHRAPDGRLMQLPVAWYAEDTAWGMAPGYDRPDHPDFRRAVDSQCMFCHNAYAVDPVREVPGTDPIFPAQLPQGIDCERCHGPGGEHVQTARSGAALAAIRAAILNPARLPLERQLEICMQCHLQPDSRLLPSSLRRSGRGVFSYDPREPLSAYSLFFVRTSPEPERFEVNHAAYRLRESVCFRASSGRLVCTTCHDPHEVARGDTAERACRGCHTSLPRTHPAGSGCASCHMPKRRTQDATHVVMTDHRISRRPPVPDPLRRVAEVQDDPYRGEVALYYPARATGGEFDLDLAVAQVRDAANLGGGIPRLRHAIELPNARAEYSLALAEAYRQSGNAAQAAVIYEKVLQQFSGPASAWLALGQALVASGQPARAASAMESGLRSVSPSAPLLNFLGAVYQQTGDLMRSAGLFRRAIALSPEVPEPHLNLGVTLSRQGNLEDAIEAFREAIRLAPDLAAAHNNLAYLLAAGGRSEEAGFHFREAIRNDPDYWAAHLGYGRLLAAASRWEEARAHFRQAARSPDESIRREALASLQ
jgi:tetratricopeptide (TPR) repeat protein